jgi:hypothetical protein
MTQAKQLDHRLTTALESRFGRRPLLKAGIGVLALAATAAYHINQRYGDPLREQRATWERIEGTQEEFIERYAEKFSRMKLGANISPDYRLFVHDLDPEAIMAFLAEEQGCEHVRLGIRWSTYDEQGIAPYLPYYKAAQKNNIKINTTLPGPKNPRWPEEHIPTRLVEELQAIGHFPPPGYLVRAGSPLAVQSIAAAEQFLNDLEENDINPVLLDYCPVNELRDAFGRWGLRMDQDFMYEYADLLNRRAPGSAVLFNTVGVALDYPSPLSICTEYARDFQNEFPSLRFTVGVDFYHQTRYQEIDASIDTISANKLRYGLLDIPQALATIALNNLRFEVTEAQKEPWGNRPLQYPPGTEMHFRYVLARIADQFVDVVPGMMPDTDYVVRIWGYEDDLVQMRAEPDYVASNPIFSLIQAVNALQPEPAPAG